ncbi:MAG: tetratricopeptide repeat protein [Deltaproteobacteria bacterium]|nr:tetratricopeptide repeat protein [Deltaproteobacteria bacterium]
MGVSTPPQGVSRVVVQTKSGMGAVQTNPPPTPRIAVRDGMLDRLTPKVPIPPVLGDHDEEPPERPADGIVPVATEEGISGLVINKTDIFAGDLEAERLSASLVPEELGARPSPPPVPEGAPTIVDAPVFEDSAPVDTALKQASKWNTWTQPPDTPPRSRTKAVALALLVLTLFVGASVALWIFVPEAGDAPGDPDAVATAGDPGSGAGTPIAAADDAAVEDAGSAALDTSRDGGAAADTGAGALAAAAAGDGTEDDGTEDDGTEDEGTPAGIDPSRSARSLVAEGERLIRRDDFAAASPLLERAYELDPDDNHVLAGLARVYIAQGDGPRAVEMAAAACQKRARRASYRMLLGEANELVGDVGAARQAYARVIAQEPNHSGARERLAALRE